MPATPEKAAPRTVALFLSEYIPGVKNEYAMIEMACDGPPKINLLELQMESKRLKFPSGVSVLTVSAL